MMKINTTQVQKQILAPVLQQSIEILLLPIGDLRLSIENELQTNPVLEMDESARAEEQRLEDALMSHLGKNSPVSERSQGQSEDSFSPIKKEETLEDALLKQLRMEISDPLELRIGEEIIGNLDEDGYLKVSCEDISAHLKIHDLHHIEKVLATVQSFEPAGIAARNLAECLLIQVKDRYSDDPVLKHIILNHMPQLGQKKYDWMAKKLNVSPEEIQRAAFKIASLDPKPARNFRPIDAGIYISPDIHIQPDDNGGFAVNMNNDVLPPLRINPYYQKLLKENSHLKDEEKQFIRDKIKTALTFIKSIAERGKTLTAIAKFILDNQGNFFTDGTLSLVPMNLRDVANALSRNESTISRAIHHKYIQTPHGLFPLKFFFSQGINHNGNGQGNGPAIATRSIKEEIRELIGMEDKASPLSDQEIMKYFTEKGIILARRTVSKYRQLLKIPPSHLRK